MSLVAERKKIIIDTDPGVDDAMAIIMALDAHKRQQIEIIAITLVKGNASLKDAERNILRVLEIFKLENTVSYITLNLSLDLLFYMKLWTLGTTKNFHQQNIISDTCICWKRK